MLNKLYFTLSLFSAICSYSAELTIIPQIRTRTENRLGYRVGLNDTNSLALFTVQRARMNISMKYENIELFIAPQDVRVWGQQFVQGTLASFEMHEAWGKFNINDNIGLKLGRQEIQINKDRIIGNIDWITSGVSHDAVVIYYKEKDTKINLGLAYNQTMESLINSFYSQKNYKSLAYLDLSSKTSDREFYLMNIVDGLQKSEAIQEIAWRNTFGIELEDFNNTLPFSLGLYYQSGKTQDNKNISSHMINSKISQSFNSFKLNLGLDVISGSQNNNNYGAFNTLYGTNHKFYGYMDYYLNIPKDTKEGGLNDIYVELKYNLNKDNDFALKYHTFMLNTNKFVKTSGEKYDASLGNELDFTYNYNGIKFVKLTFGASVYNQNETIAFIKGASNQRLASWAYLMLNIVPGSFKISNGN